MNDLLNKVITISGKEEKLTAGKPVMKIKDENNLTYSVWKFKQDGTESVAWGQIPDIGDTVQIGYVEDTKNHPEHGTTTYRTIRSFNKDIGQGVLNHRQQQNRPNTGHSVVSGRDFDKENVGKCQSLFLQAYIQAGHTFEEAKLQAGPARKLAEIVVYGHTQPDTVEEYQDPFLSEEIPF